MDQPNVLVPLIRRDFDIFFLILFSVFLMGFLAAIPYTVEASEPAVMTNTNKKTINKLNKELGFDLVERLMQVCIEFLKVRLKPYLSRFAKCRFSQKTNKQIRFFFLL